MMERLQHRARFEWHEVKKVEHYWLRVDALTRPMRLPEGDDS